MARRGSVASLLSAALLAAGCTQVTPGGDGAGPDIDEAPPAVVTRGTIVSVLTVDALIVATPDFAVKAATDGVVSQAPLRGGDVVEAGEPVASQGEDALTLPVDGFLVEWLVPDAASVYAGVPVARFRYAGFGAVAAIPDDLAYRLYDGPTGARLQMADGAGPSRCELLSVAGDDSPTAGSEGSREQGVPVLCAVPQEVRAVNGTSGVLGLTTGERADVLTLPVQAVAGSADLGRVVKMIDGEPALAEVTLGITDGVRVEIVAGLDEGDEVWPYGPGLRPGLPGQQ